MNKDFLKNRRKELGLSLSDMAKRLELKGARADNDVYRYETCKIAPKTFDLIKFIEAYELSDQELRDYLKYINEEKYKNNK